MAATHPDACFLTVDDARALFLFFLAKMNLWLLCTLFVLATSYISQPDDKLEKGEMERKQTMNTR